MGEWLPGTPKERLKETRKAKRFSQKKVADFLGIDKATYGRIESGEIRTINSDCLIRLADLYGTTTDYLLGLSNVPERTYYDVERLGLSVNAAKNLLSGKADGRVMNELLLNKKFLTATRMMASYFTLSVMNYVQAKSELLAFNLAEIEELADEGALQVDGELIRQKTEMEFEEMIAAEDPVQVIHTKLMAALEEIRAKMVSECEEAIKARELLNYEIMGAAWAEAKKVPRPQDLSEEEKLALVKETMRKGIRMDKSVTGKKLEKMDEAIEGAAVLLRQLYETAEKEQGQVGSIKD